MLWAYGGWRPSAWNRCPVQSCVCDWDGTWPEESEGFAGWDLGSLGIPHDGRQNATAQAWWLEGTNLLS